MRRAPFLRRKLRVYEDLVHRAVSARRACASDGPQPRFGILESMLYEVASDPLVLLLVSRVQLDHDHVDVRLAQVQGLQDLELGALDVQ